MLKAILKVADISSQPSTYWMRVSKFAIYVQHSLGSKRTWSRCIEGSISGLIDWKFLKRCIHFNHGCHTVGQRVDHDNDIGPWLTDSSIRNDWYPNVPRPKGLAQLQTKPECQKILHATLFAKAVPVCTDNRQHQLLVPPMRTDNRQQKLSVLHAPSISIACNGRLLDDYGKQQFMVEHFNKMYPQCAVNNQEPVALLNTYEKPSSISRVFQHATRTVLL